MPSARANPDAFQFARSKSTQSTSGWSDANSRLDRGSRAHHRRARRDDAHRPDVEAGEPRRSKRGPTWRPRPSMRR